MLLIEDSESYDVISRENRQEFLFRLFQHICLGGELVQKDPETKQVMVVSTVLKVKAYEQSFAYLLTDPFKRHVYVLYHSYGVGIFTLA
ncbi:hypothetical protein JZ751_008352, partial [Albula glossodonta]